MIVEYAKASPVINNTTIPIKVKLLVSKPIKIFPRIIDNMNVVIIVVKLIFL